MKPAFRYSTLRMVGRGKEVLLSPKDGHVLAWFEDGYLFGVGRPNNPPYSEEEKARMAEEDTGIIQEAA